MKIGILTSSRADYGIYLPLLKALKADPFFDLHMLVFGAHMSEKFGYTKSQIEADGFSIGHQLNTMPENDTPGDIVRSMAKTQSEFSSVWGKESFDLIFALGDRYEMFAAVSSTVPFNLSVAHIHGGETTLGAIDNVFRHCITSMADYHFTTCEQYRKRVIDIKGSEKGVFNVGALSIDTLATVQFLSIKDFYKKYNINLANPTILFTFHPETVSFHRNEEYIKVLTEVLAELKQYQIVITMPNADTNGNIIRNYLKSFIDKNQNAFGIESFGSLGYLSCMKYCSFMLGNTSSGKCWR
jgi:GDP/UDP-N,N'-diacetylbacillosamine 2-epimerase (hydrolysing)